MKLSNSWRNMHLIWKMTWCHKKSGRIIWFLNNDAMNLCRQKYFVENVRNLYVKWVLFLASIYLHRVEICFLYKYEVCLFWIKQSLSFSSMYSVSIKSVFCVFYSDTRYVFCTKKRSVFWIKVFWINRALSFVLMLFVSLQGLSRN